MTLRQRYEAAKRAAQLAFEGFQALQRLLEARRAS